MLTLTLNKARKYRSDLALLKMGVSMSMTREEGECNKGWRRTFSRSFMLTMAGVVLVGTLHLLPCPPRLEPHHASAYGYGRMHTHNSHAHHGSGMVQERVGDGAGEDRGWCRRGVKVQKSQIICRRRCV